MPVDSEALAGVGYDPRRWVLEIEFAGGGVYRYHGVSPATHHALMQAPSHGRYFAAHIRDRYRYTKA